MGASCHQQWCCRAHTQGIPKYASHGTCFPVSASEDVDGCQTSEFIGHMIVQVDSMVNCHGPATVIQIWFELSEKLRVMERLAMVCAGIILIECLLPLDWTHWTWQSH